MSFHEPVLLSEALARAHFERPVLYIDMTLGGGGYTEKLLESVPCGAVVLSLDVDPEAVQEALSRVKPRSDVTWIVLQENFSQIEDWIEKLELPHAAAAFFDFGVSSRQLDEPEKGFTYRTDAPLDMRLDPRLKLTAERVLNEYEEHALAKVFFYNGEEKYSREIARKIVAARKKTPIKTSGELNELVAEVIFPRFLNKSLSRIYQALRIEVNREFDAIQSGLESAFRALEKGGVLVCVSYHSLEDRLVKRFMNRKETKCVCPPEYPVCVCGKIQEGKVLVRKAVKPTDREIAQNPRARSARLRAMQKVA